MFKKWFSLTLFVGLSACGSGQAVDQSVALNQGGGNGATGCQAALPDPNACPPADPHKSIICHIPPGNPANAHTLCVGTPAVPAHLAHGDYLGVCKCPDGGTTPPTVTPPAGDMAVAPPSTAGADMAAPPVR